MLEHFGCPCETDKLGQVTGMYNRSDTASEWRRAESGHKRGPKTVPAQTTEVMSFSLFSLDFKPKVLVVMLFLW